jgi:hypothetical protein
MGIVRRSSIGWLLAVFVALAGCRPSCGAVCDKVRGCELSSQQAQQECVNQCEAQASEYDTDDAKDAAWVDHLQCVERSSCTEIDQGACYDTDLFGF